MSRASTALGLFVAVAGAAALPVALEATSGGVDLAVRVPRRHEVLANDDAPRGAAVHLPRDGVRVGAPQRARGAGVEFKAFSVDYGEAWHREVVWPALVGPFIAEGKGVCGYAVHLGAGLFDTRRAGAGLKAAVHRRVVERFPRRLDKSGIHVEVPEVKATDLEISFAQGFVWVHLDVHLVDGTSFVARVPVRVLARDGTPLFQRHREIESTFKLSGPLEREIVRQAGDLGAVGGAALGCTAGAVGGPLGCVIGALVGVLGGAAAGEAAAESEIPTQARAMGETQVDAVLGELGLGMRRIGSPIHLNRDRPGDAITLALRADPQVTPSGLSFGVCVSVSTATPRVDSSVPGSPTWNAAPPTITSKPDAEIAVAMNADALQQVVYFAWQSGVLSRAGRSTAVLERMPKEVQLAAFDFEGFSPTLPPVLDPSASGLRFLVPDVDIGKMGDSQVVTHGAVNAEIVQTGDELRFRGTLEKLWLNCVRVRGGAARLTPCMSDLLPIVREKAVGHPLEGAISGGDVLSQLPNLSFQGMNVHLSKLRVHTGSQPLNVGLRVQARIEAKP